MTNEPAIHKSILSSVPTYNRGRYLIVPYWFEFRWLGWNKKGSWSRLLTKRIANKQSLIIGPIQIRWDVPTHPCRPYVHGYFVGVAENEQLLHEAESALQQATNELDTLKAQIAQAKETER